MATAGSASSSRFCLLLLMMHLVIAAATLVGAAAPAAGSSADRVLLRVDSLFPGPSSCTSTQERKPITATSSAARVPIVHRHGPCSPLAGAHAGKPPSHAEILAADQNRVESLHHRVSSTTTGLGGKPRTKKKTPGHSSVPASSSSSSSSVPASSGLSLGTANYVVPIGLGTPPSRFTVVFDTGSDTTWVQCRPCVVSCYKQKDRLFDPAKSSTYANVSCADPACADLDASGCNAGHCLYGIQYGDGSYTVGFFAKDTLAVAQDAIKGFKFGCGEKNRGLFGQTAGLLGLGRGPTSITVQAYEKYGGSFSYCLPASSAATGYLEFGPLSPSSSGSNAKTTPMLTDKGPTFYYVGLTGIRVGGKQLGAIPESVFSNSGTLVDSGTVITRLPDTAYAALSSAFAAAMAASGYKKAAAYSILDTCYDFTGLSQVSLPTVSLVFQGGACLDLDASGIVYAISQSQVCLGFASNGDDESVGIVGNTQQRTYGVLYDVSKKVVGFAPGAC